MPTLRAAISIRAKAILAQDIRPCQRICPRCSHSLDRGTVARYLRNKSARTSDEPATKLNVKDITWLMLKKPADLTDKERALVDDLREADEDIEKASDLAARFCKMLRSHSETAPSVQTWITNAMSAGMQALEDFAQSLTKDILAVTKAFTQGLSNGMTEGAVNKVKMIKRKAYGRAKFDLLRARVLRAP